MISDFTLFKNRYRELYGQAKDEAGNVMDISDPVRLIFKMVSLGDSDKNLEKTSAQSTEIEKTDAPAGEYTVYIRIADTVDLPEGEYRYEVAFIDDPGSPIEVYTLNPKTIEEGILELKDTLIEVP